MKILRRLRAAIHLRRLRRGFSARQAVMTYMLTTLGNTTIMWASINLIINSFFEWNQARLGTEFPRGMPKAFTSKLDHLKKVEKDEHWSEEQRTEMRAIRLDLARLNTTRTELVHGLVWMTGTEDFTIYVAKEEGNDLVRRTVESNYDDLRAFRDDLWAIIQRLTDLFNPIMGLEEG